MSNLAQLSHSNTMHSPEMKNTYMLGEIDSSKCWVWGDDTSYYDGLGCIDIGGGCGGE